MEKVLDDADQEDSQKSRRRTYLMPRSTQSSVMRSALLGTEWPYRIPTRAMNIV